MQIVESLKTFQIDRPDSFDEKFVEAPGIQIVNGRKNNYVKVEGRGKGIRVVKLTARCDLEEAAAYFWDFESRANNSIGDLERKVEEVRMSKNKATITHHLTNKRSLGSRPYRDS